MKILLSLIILFNFIPSRPVNSIGVLNNEKIVYLTFDDGPSKNTPLILDILKEYDIKATFFIIHPYVDSHIPIIKRTYEEGHTLGNHTSNHEFNYVYISKEAFYKDFNKQQEFIKNITGNNCTVFRFPGGSKNTLVRNAHGSNFTKDIMENLKSSGINTYDWNVDSGDATGNNIPSSILFKNVVRDLKDKTGNEKNPAIVLMHDTMNKKTTVEALPDIIKFFKDNGYIFDTLK